VAYGNHLCLKEKREKKMRDKKRRGGREKEKKRLEIELN
jgi:hypothetical protein